MTDTWMEPDPDAPPAQLDLRTDRPHPARTYDYLLGGKNNFPADRAAAEAALLENPTARVSARANRAFMHRVVRYLAAEAGVRQFLDIGTGIPTAPNVHEIAQEVHRDARVLYVDNDPIVLVHARALLTSTPEGRTEYLDADFLDPDRILAGASRMLDLTQPVGLLVIALTHFMPDDLDPHRVIRRLLEPLPSGSYLAMTNGTQDIAPEMSARLLRMAAERGIPARMRTRAEFATFFDGLELVDPGITLVHRWHPTEPEENLRPDADVSVYGALARKP